MGTESKPCGLHERPVKFSAQLPFDHCRKAARVSTFARYVVWQLTNSPNFYYNAFTDSDG